ncbi:hypothetical protein H2200_010363 [Cladophialophora chaetospira]|uniref:Uncharacterized protein n=1 Tax=Cladophialophora chaetospira TaxID=386627 RepID=A0AA38X1C1_9EURO|nr:hypothetical protein H2200_010363 [Cladophialophora chaetospira]
MSIEDDLRSLSAPYSQPNGASTWPEPLDAQVIGGITHIIQVLNKLKTQLSEIVQTHPILPADRKSAILAYLHTEVISELAQVVPLLGQDPLDVFVISTRLYFAARGLVTQGLELEWQEIVDVSNLVRVDVAFARLRRTEAWHACLKELSSLRGSPTMEEFERVEAVDLFKCVLSGMEATQMFSDASEGEPFSGGTSGRDSPVLYSSIFLPCCKQAVLGSIHLQLGQNKCPLCDQGLEDEQVAKLVHDRIHGLQTAVGRWDPDAERKAADEQNLW